MATTWTPPPGCALPRRTLPRKALVIQQSGGLERSIEIWDKPFYTLGRFGADVLLHGEGASRTHAVIFHNEVGETCIVDLGSKHGTYIHDFRLEPHWPHPWKDGVIVTFGPPGKRDRAWLLTCGTFQIRGTCPAGEIQGNGHNDSAGAHHACEVPEDRHSDAVGSCNGVAASRAVGKQRPDVLSISGDVQQLPSSFLPPRVEAQDASHFLYLTPRQGICAETRPKYHRSFAQGPSAPKDLEAPPSLKSVSERHSEAAQAPAKRQRISFGDLWCSREDVVPQALQQEPARASRKASELWSLGSR